MQVLEVLYDRFVDLVGRLRGGHGELTALMLVVSQTMGVDTLIIFF